MLEGAQADVDLTGMRVIETDYVHLHKPGNDCKGVSELLADFVEEVSVSTPGESYRLSSDCIERSW